MILSKKKTILKEWFEHVKILHQNIKLIIHLFVECQFIN